MLKANTYGQSTSLSGGVLEGEFQRMLKNTPLHDPLRELLKQPFRPSRDRQLRGVTPRIRYPGQPLLRRLGKAPLMLNPYWRALQLLLDLQDLLQQPAPYLGDWVWTNWTLCWGTTPNCGDSVTDAFASSTGSGCSPASLECQQLQVSTGTLVQGQDITFPAGTKRVFLGKKAANPARQTHHQHYARTDAGAAVVRWKLHSVAPQLPYSVADAPDLTPIGVLADPTKPRQVFGRPRPDLKPWPQAPDAHYKPAEENEPDDFLPPYVRQPSGGVDTEVPPDDDYRPTPGTPGVPGVSPPARPRPTPGTGTGPGWWDRRPPVPPIIVDQPPLPGEKEKKKRLWTPAMEAVQDAFHALTEAQDAIDAIAEGLPGDLCKTGGLHEKAMCLWDNFEDIDWDKAIQELVKNHYEDKAVGGFLGASERGLKRAREAGYRPGRRRGVRMDGKARLASF